MGISKSIADALGEAGTRSLLMVGFFLAICICIIFVSKGALAEEKKLYVGNNATWNQADYFVRFMDENGTGVSLVYPITIQDNLTNLFSGDNRTVSWSQGYSTSEIKIGLSTPLKITKLRYYPLGDYTERSKMCDFWFFEYSAYDSYSQNIFGNSSVPCDVSSINYPDQYFEWKGSLVMDWIDITLMSPGPGPTYWFYTNELEIYYDPSWNPYPQSATIPEMHDEIAQLSQNASLLAQNLSELSGGLGNLTTEYGGVSSDLSALNSTVVLLGTSIPSLWQIVYALENRTGQQSSEIGNLTYLVENVTRLTGQYEALQERLDNLTGQNNMAMAFQNSTIAGQRDEINGTLANISSLQQRMAGVENNGSRPTSEVLYENSTAGADAVATTLGATGIIVGFVGLGVAAVALRRKKTE